MTSAGLRALAAAAALGCLTAQAAARELVVATHAAPPPQAGARHVAPRNAQLRPPQTGGPPPRAVRNDAGHQAVVFEVAASGGAPLRFGLVLVGRIQA